MTDESRGIGTQPLPIMALLRSATLEHHRRAEAALSDLISLEAPTRAIYTTTLVRLAGWYFPLEDRLSKAARSLASIGVMWADRRKSPSLIADLSALGYHGSIEVCNALPPVVTLSQAVGCLYVLEGATLGGQIVVRLLRAAPEMPRDPGFRFFSGYEERTASMWRTFGAAVSTSVERSRVEHHTVIRDEIVTSAQATFDSLMIWLCARARPTPEQAAIPVSELSLASH